METGPLREETAEELASITSPQPLRASGQVSGVPSIEVISPWSRAQCWSGEDQAPLISSPSSDAGQ